MATKTQEKKKQSSQIEEGWENVGGNLPPMLLLEVGGMMEGEIINVDVKIDTEKKRGKAAEKRRIFYRLKLSAAASGIDAKSKEAVAYESGDVVTLPGSGSLDNMLGNLALKIEGKPINEDEEPNYQKLVGETIRVTRTPDEKMRKGQWAGKMVKTYDVQRKKKSVTA